MAGGQRAAAAATPTWAKSSHAVIPGSLSGITTCETKPAGPRRAASWVGKCGRRLGGRLQPGLPSNLLPHILHPARGPPRARLGLLPPPRSLPLIILAILGVVDPPANLHLQAGQTRWTAEHSIFQRVGMKPVAGTSNRCVHARPGSSSVQQQLCSHASQLHRLLPTRSPPPPGCTSWCWFMTRTWWSHTAAAGARGGCQRAAAAAAMRQCRSSVRAPHTASRIKYRCRRPSSACALISTHRAGQAQVDFCPPKGVKWISVQVNVDFCPSQSGFLSLERAPTAAPGAAPPAAQPGAAAGCGQHPAAALS